MYIAYFRDNLSSVCNHYNLFGMNCSVISSRSFTNIFLILNYLGSRRLVLAVISPFIRGPARELRLIWYFDSIPGTKQADV